MSRILVHSTLLAAVVAATGLLQAPAQANNMYIACEEYANLYTVYADPGAQPQTTRYRNIFRPVQDQCNAAGGPRYMPNGYANSPTFRPPQTSSNPPPSAPPANPNQGPCEEYGRLLTAFVAPAAQMGTNEYRSVYFPARDQCLSVNGPRYMPNGYATSPYFRPTATTSNPPPTTTPPPATPPTSTGPATPPPTSTGPASPPPTSTGGANGPSSPGSTPTGGVTSPQAAAAALYRTLPAGMSYPDAVQWALVGCNIYAEEAAYAAGTPASTPFVQAGRAAAQNCMDRGGHINGQFQNPPSVVMLAAMRAAYTKSQACQSWEGQPGVSVCVNGNGEWTTCYQGQCYPSGPPAWVNDNQGVSQGTTNFASCAGGSCLHGPAVDNPRNYPTPPVPNPNGPPGRNQALRDAMASQCSNATSPSEKYFCGFNLCMQQQLQAGANAIAAGEFCEAAMLDITGNGFEQMLAAQFTTVPPAFAAAWAYYKRVLRAKFVDPLFKDQVRRAFSEMMSGPASKMPSPNIYLKGLGISSASSFIQDLFFGIALRLHAIADPCRSGLMPPQACASTSALTAGSTARPGNPIGTPGPRTGPTIGEPGRQDAPAGTGPSARPYSPVGDGSARPNTTIGSPIGTGRAVGASSSGGLDYAAGCREAYVTSAPLRSLELPADVERGLSEALAQDCIDNAPLPGQMSAVFAQLLAVCLGTGNGSNSDIAGWSAGANSCLWRVYQTAPRGSRWLNVDDARAGAKGLSAWLAGCSQVAGAVWVGNGASGYAQPAAGAPPMPLPQFLASVRGCMSQIPPLLQ